MFSHSTEEARASLQAVERVKQRTLTLAGYEKGAPHLFLWGTIWFVGYGLGDFYPQLAGRLWILLNCAGFVGSILIRLRHGAERRGTTRYIVSVLAVVLFVLATYFVMHPQSSAQLNAFPALVVACGYVVVGTWLGVRLAIAGFLLGTATLIGYGMFQEHLALWLAIVGGGTLILSGLWLRRA